MYTYAIAVQNTWAYKEYTGCPKKSVRLQEGRAVHKRTLFWTPCSFISLSIHAVYVSPDPRNDWKEDDTWRREHFSRKSTLRIKLIEIAGEATSIY